MCGCVKEIDEKLKEHNAALVTTMFGEPKVVLSTYKIDEKKRSRTPSVLATCCPFCGEKYASKAEAA